MRDTVLTVLLLPLYFLPALVAVWRNHHSAPAIFVANLVPGGLLVALLALHQSFVEVESPFSMFAIALSGQLVVYQLVPWAAGLAWALAMIWSLTHVVPDTTTGLGGRRAGVAIAAIIFVGRIRLVIPNFGHYCKA